MSKSYLRVAQRLRKAVFRSSRDSEKQFPCTQRIPKTLSSSPGDSQRHSPGCPEISKINLQVNRRFPKAFCRSPIDSQKHSPAHPQTPKSSLQHYFRVDNGLVFPRLRDPAREISTSDVVKHATHFTTRTCEASVRILHFFILLFFLKFLADNLAVRICTRAQQA